MTVPLSVQANEKKIDNSPSVKSGRRLTTELKLVFSSLGYQVIKAKNFIHTPSHNFVILGEYLDGIYGNKKLDFVLYMKKGGKPIIVEAMRQRVKGSTDEKLPYTYLNAIKFLPKFDTIFVYEGNGFRKGAIKFMKDKAQETGGFEVMEKSDFIYWLENNK